MMPDLGTYTVWVLSAYGVSLGLLAAIIGLSIVQARRALRDLRQMEEGRARARAASESSQGHDLTERTHG
ncbi:MAG: heme exporter protein CcmD [Pseudomonadota bacterium]